MGSKTAFCRLMIVHYWGMSSSAFLTFVCGGVAGVAGWFQSGWGVDVAAACS